MTPTVKVGSVFGHYRVIAKAAPALRNATRWLCRCVCRNERVVYQSNLTGGLSKSCGCRGEGQQNARAEKRASSQQIELPLHTGGKIEVGQLFGLYRVIAKAHGQRTRQGLWLCRCECGAERVISAQQLRLGNRRSCGCARDKKLYRPADRAPVTTHGMSKSREYRTYQGMRSRCLNRNHHAYPYYGGRGIIICTRWLASFDNFYADMGPRPERTSLDRIDGDGNYEPSNCRWATSAEQNEKLQRRCVCCFRVLDRMCPGCASVEAAEE